VSSSDTNNLAGKTIFITGASRGIGEAIALRAAREGANIVVAAKTVEANPKLPGTIHSVAGAVQQAGGTALPLQLDIRDEEQITSAVERAVREFGGIDVLVNNASAISLTGTLETPMKRVDLMWDVNMRGTFACSQACLPYLLKASNPHILTLSPPIVMDQKWFARHTAYTISKYGMSMCVLGLAAEFRQAGVAVNALWPKSVIHTAALAMLGGLVRPEQCRSPQIVADAAVAILQRKSRDCTGQFFLDEEVLMEEGISDLGDYAISPGTELFTDLFVEQD
jgi:citronellol/citronellal dehydrogenase